MADIVHLTSVHPRDDVRIFGKQCRSLAQQGHRVTLVVADGHGHDWRDGVHIVDAGAARGRWQRMAMATARVLEAAIALDAQIYQLHDPELLPAGLRLKRRGKKVVYDAHEDLPLQLLGKPYLHPWARRGAALAARRYLRWACPRLDGVIAATPHIRDWFLGLHPRTVDINNYPLPEEFPPGPAWERKPLQVCYAGGLSEIRGIRELVRACELLRTPARLGLAGEFSEPALAAQMRAAPGWERVDAHGRLGRAAVCALLAQSRAGLVTLHPLAHHRDALPVKLFEYMAAGIPVIASDFARWRAIVDQARCGLCVDPLEPAAIAAAIDYLLERPELAREMGDNGRQAVAARYNWTTESHKLSAFYEQL